MHKTSIFWNSKLRFAFLIFSISLLFLSCSSNSGYFNKPISNNKPITDNKPVIDPDNPTIPIFPNVFTLGNIPSAIPTEDTWIVLDSGSPTEEDFNALEEVLENLVDREIKLEFPNIEKIPNNAFYSTPISSLVSVRADNATSIGEYAFFDCTALTTVSFANALTIGEFAFNGCSSLTTVNIPNVTNIEMQAFIKCSNLESITLPKVTTIGGWVFSDCASLTTVNIPEAQIIATQVFRNCAALTTMTIATSSATLNLNSHTFYEAPVDKITVTTSALNKSKFDSLGFYKIIEQTNK